MRKVTPNKRIRRGVARGLNATCCAVDAIAYRPAVVKLTMLLPRLWRCQLERLGMWLDDRWAIGYWADDSGPAAPSGIWDCCRRRAAWLYVGDYANDPEFEDDRPPADDFLARRRVNLCAWCRPDFADVSNENELEECFAAARRASISWRWRGP